MVWGGAIAATVVSLGKYPALSVAVAFTLVHLFGACTWLMQWTGGEYWLLFGGYFPVSSVVLVVLCQIGLAE